MGICEDARMLHRLPPRARRSLPRALAGCAAASIALAGLVLAAAAPRVYYDAHGQTIAGVGEHPVVAGSEEDLALRAPTAVILSGLRQAESRGCAAPP